MKRFFLLSLVTILFSPLASKAQNFWQRTNGPFGRPIYSLAINSSKHIFAGTFGGVFRTTDNGGNWILVGLTNSDVRSLAINSSGHVFAGTLSGIFRSTDNGGNWVQAGLKDTAVLSLAINSGGHIFAGTVGRGVFRSTNNGGSWTPVSIGLLTNANFSSFAINSVGHLFVGTVGSGIFRSTNNGESWLQVGLTNDNVRSLTINSSGHVFASTDIGGVYYSIDNGDNWMQTGLGFSILESRKQEIKAAQGGTITLPSGSRVAIPAGVLTGDQSVSLSLLSSLPKQPPSGLITNVGPVLSLTFTGTLNSGAGDIQYEIDFSNSTAKGFEGSSPISQVVIPQLSVDDYRGVRGTVDIALKRATVVIPSSITQNYNIGVSQTTINVALANVPPEATCPGFNPGGKFWNRTQRTFIGYDCSAKPPAGFDSTKKTLVLIHGVNSTVKDAFGSDCGNGTVPANEIMMAGGYDQVVGFDYDWTQPIETSGQQLASFLECLRNAGISKIDIEAHSEGVPVSLSAASKTNIPIENMVLLGGPIMGTPVANKGEYLKTVLSYWPAKCLYGFNRPLETILSGAFLNDLKSNSVILDSIRARFNARNQNPNVLTVAGTRPFNDAELFLLADIISEPIDGLIPLSSALGRGSGLRNLKEVGSYFVSHTQLECDPTVQRGVSYALQGIKSFTLTVGTAGTGSGTVAVNPPGFVYPVGDSVTLTAQPDDGSTFSGWSGACSGTGFCRITMDTNKAVTANFAKTIGCSYSISPSSQSFKSSSGSGAVTVTTSSDCGWTAESKVSWITITSGSSGSGTRTVTYSVAANTGSSQRTGTITIAGQNFTVIQEGSTVPCSSTQVQGGNTPETRTIQMGRNSGTFTFSYDTYTIPDRMVVLYEGRTLFDTGCCGCSGSVNLTYSGTSTTISVQVSPNCAGTAGTAWTFTVSCPR